MEKGSYHQPLCYPTTDWWWLGDQAHRHKPLYHKCRSLCIAGSRRRRDRLPQTPAHAVRRTFPHLTWRWKLSITFIIPERLGSRTILLFPAEYSFWFLCNLTTKKREKPAYCYHGIVSSQDFCVSKGEVNIGNIPGAILYQYTQESCTFICEATSYITELQQNKSA